VDLPGLGPALVLAPAPEPWPLPGPEPWLELEPGHIPGLGRMPAVALARTPGPWPLSRAWPAVARVRERVLPLVEVSRVWLAVARVPEPVRVRLRAWPVALAGEAALALQALAARAGRALRTPMPCTPG
jgi:hypothetical protein